MRKFLLGISLMLFSISSFAGPARPGIYRTLQLADGTTIRAQLCGDEHINYWATDNGERFRLIEGKQIGGKSVYEPVTVDQLEANRKFISPRNTLEPKFRFQTTVQNGVQRAMPVSTALKGKKKGLIILAEFTNQKFQPADNQALYNRIANERNFKYGKFQGSVKDYFLDQSEGQFELDFDVVGPITTDSAYEYYGANDMDAYKMVVEACRKVDSQVNFKDYDWDGDGEVDQVMVIFAGQGASDGGGASTIWPHEYNLVGARGSKLYLDGVSINTYAVSNEVDANWDLEGIGTICHEFAHCLGFADHYDTFYSGWFGTSRWDLMSYGEWNNGGFTPAGFLGFERMQAGWRTPIVLSDKDTTVTALKPINEGGDFYAIYNQANDNEFYLLENRQQTGWDKYIPASGMLVWHVDYDPTIWKYNYVNTRVDNRNVSGSDGVYNNHQRLTLIHADNDDDQSYWSSRSQTYSKYTYTGDPYPYNGNDSLTNNSVPVASLYNANSDGKRYMNHGVKNITLNADSTISFDYLALSKKIPTSDSLALANRPDTTGAIFYESFNECHGTGGNDGIFRGSSEIASAEFEADNGGWQALYAGGGAYCVKLGNSTHAGVATSPEINLTEGENYEFSFYAAPWSRDGTDLNVFASDGAELGQTEFAMTRGAWTHFKTTISGNGSTKLTFSPESRFFLDEVLIKKVSSTTGITRVNVDNTATGAVQYFSITGQKLAGPSKGVYIKRYADGHSVKVIGK